MSSNAWLVFVALLSGATASLFTTLVTGPGNVPAPPSLASVVDFSDLTERFDRLIRTLQERPSAFTAAGDATRSEIQRQPMDEPDAVAALAREIEDLKALVRSQPSTASSPTMEVTRIGPSYPQTNWDAVRGLREQITQSPRTASSGHLFLTPSSILQLYGRPTGILKEGSQWDYYEEQADGDTLRRASFTFHDGYVTRVF